LFVYNFGSKTVRGSLAVDLPEHWKAQGLPNVEIEPGERKELALHLRHPQNLYGKDAKVRVTGHFGEAGTPVLAFRLTTSRD
jgi:hypothetical protein